MLKYLSSTCYYVGPVLAPCMDASAVFQKVFASDLAAANDVDQWGSGAVLIAAQVLLALLCPGPDE